MIIRNFLAASAINVSLKSKTKPEVLAELIEPLVKSGKVADRQAMVDVLLEREELGSTGIGQRIAIPHGKSGGVKELAASFGISREGIAFEALDGEPVNIFFVLVAPDGSAGVHLKALAKISGLLKDKFLRKALLNAQDSATVLKVLSSDEEESGA